jgi:hypothetical protein
MKKFIRESWPLTIVNANAASTPATEIEDSLFTLFPRLDSEIRERTVYPMDRRRVTPSAVALQRRP